MTSGAQALYVFGRIEYRDAFDAHRFTAFRFVWRGERVGAGGLRREPAGNEAD